MAQVPLTQTEEKIVQVKNEVLKIVNVDRIVERNIETIKEVTSGRERIVQLRVDRIIEIPIIVNVPQVLSPHMLNNVVQSPHMLHNIVSSQTFYRLTSSALSARKLSSSTLLQSCVT